MMLSNDIGISQYNFLLSLDRQSDYAMVICKGNHLPRTTITLNILSKLYLSWHRRLDGRAGTAHPFNLLLRLPSDDANDALRNVPRNGTTAHNQTDSPANVHAWPDIPAMQTVQSCQSVGDRTAETAQHQV
ncbi:hypothetical protein DPMN_179484 [Dreissena polymorpha]|uniref:Uncharacterized protein n=1 Tax=Dreissena polymorpha TaxID=45954 RepID=A0A9D4EG63_DREPO|nr:hypothetical protein DPMN_179484 [Dreissena polymorpha]